VEVETRLVNFSRDSPWASSAALSKILNSHALKDAYSDGMIH
jgi:hypothetical protein